MKNLISLNKVKISLGIIFLVFLNITNIRSECPPYYIPEIPTASDFDFILYIDPSSPTNGDGTMQNPYNTFDGITVNPNTAYLFKRGTLHDESIERVWNNNLVGAYGQGPMPVIYGFGVSASGSITSQNLVVRDIEFRKVGPDGVVFGFVHDPRPNNVTIAFCKIIGIDEGNGYPEHTLNHGAHNLIFFNNEVGGCRRNGWWLNGDNIKIIRNWFYKINTSGEESLNPGDGDVIQSIYGFQDGYIAGNILDKSNAMWKYVLMFNLEGFPDVPSTNITVEYNTFHSNKQGEGGAAVRWVVGPNCSFKKNVINSIGLATPFDRSNSNQWKQEAPYGIRDNHILIEDGRDIGSYGIPSREAIINQDNMIFNSNENYNTYINENSEIGLYGSDINPNTFLTTADEICGILTPHTYTLDLSIAGDGSVTIEPDKPEYAFGETVELIAEAHTGWKFDGWSGSLDANESPVIVTMDENKSITATFQEITNEPESYIIQSAAGIGNTIFIQPATAGNLLVAVLAHRQDPMQEPNIPEGFTLREVIQFKSNEYDRHGVLICDKIANGGETSFNTNFGTTSDLGGIVIEFDIQEAIFFEANSNTSGNEQPSVFTEVVPQPNIQYLSVTAAVSRYASSLTDWDNGFISPLAELGQLGVATRLDTEVNKPSTVSVQNSGNQGAIIASSWSIGMNITPTFTVTTSETGSGNITLDPQKTEYELNDLVQVIASPELGWEFSSWDGDLSGNSNPETILITGDANIEAIFEPISYLISGISAPLEGGQISGMGNFQNNTTANLFANPNEGYSFTNWTENGVIVSSEATYSFTVTSNRTLVANFSNNSYSVAISASPSAGGNVAGAGNYNHGQTATITATPNSGYSFVNWTENGSVISSQAGYSFTVTSNRTMVANFSNNSYNVAISASPSAGGNVAGAGNYNHGQTATITATPNSGYSFVNWTENGNVISSQASYSFTVTSNRTLVANFSNNSYNVAISASPSTGGNVAGAGNYNHGQTATITASPNTGYSFVNWTENGSVISSQASYSFTVTNNRTLVANFSNNSYTISLSANPSMGGSVVGAGNYYFGQNATIMALANDGFTFLSWTENGTIVSTNETHTFEVTNSVSIRANFTLNTHSVSLSRNPAAGGSVAGGGNYLHGQTATINASPNDAYNFTNWTESGTIISNNPTYSFTVLEERNLSANFEIKTYNLSLQPSPEEGGSVSGTGTYAHGETAILSAIAAEGYDFIYWEEDNNIISTNPDTEIVVTSDRTLNARFEKQLFELNLSASPLTAGNVSGNGFYEHMDLAIIKAIPAPGYNFLYWIKDNYVLSFESEESIIITESQTITAHFEVDPDASRISGEVFPAGYGIITGAGIYQADDEVLITATPLDNSFVFVEWQESGEFVSNEPAITFLASGNRTLRAVFDYQPGEFEVKAGFESEDLASNATINGDGFYDIGETAVLEVFVPKNVKFEGWTNSLGQIVSRSNPFEFEVNRNIELVARLKVKEFDEDEIVIYPNPSDGIFFLTILTEANIEIYNSKGILVQTRFLAEGDNQVNATELPIGIYYVKIITTEKIETKKIIIK